MEEPGRGQCSLDPMKADAEKSYWTRESCKSEAGGIVKASKLFSKHLVLQKTGQGSVAAGRSYPKGHLGVVLSSTRGITWQELSPFQFTSNAPDEREESFIRNESLFSIL